MPSLIELQLDVLFVQNAHGRLASTRDPTPEPAPRFFLGRSGATNVWRVREDIDQATTTELDRLCRVEPKLADPEVRSTPECRERVCALLAPVEFEYRGPAFVLPEKLPHDDRAREVTANESSEWFDAFPWLVDQFDALSPVAIAFDAGRAAAVCHSPRGCTVTVAEAGVETLEPFRGRGLATAAVACWARAVQRTGRVALYSTLWENAASQGIARRLSAKLYGENWHLT